MRIIRNEETATLTLVPVEEEEERIVASLLATLQPGEKMAYGGRGRDEVNPEYCIIRLHAGSTQEKVSNTNGGFTHVRTVHVGGIELVLRGTSEDDKVEVGRIRDLCYFATGGLIFHGPSEVDGRQAIVMIGKLCKRCSVPMIGLESEWGICDACARLCAHEYVRGATHGGGVSLGVGNFCSLCGRPKPKSSDERQLTELEQHLALERMGFAVLYKDFPGTPQNAVAVHRLLRGYRRSVARRH